MPFSSTISDLIVSNGDLLSKLFYRNAEFIDVVVIVII